VTYKDQFESAMKCTTKEEADLWLVIEVDRYEREFGIPANEALATIRINLGYMAGYYDRGTSAKVRDLFGAMHPIFGDLAANPPTAEQAFEAGKKWAEENVQV